VFFRQGRHEANFSSVSSSYCGAGPPPAGKPLQGAGKPYCWAPSGTHTTTTNGNPRGGQCGGYGSDVYEDRALWACYPLAGWYVTDSTPVLRVLDSTSLRCT
jgi:hypothetical protein